MLTHDVYPDVLASVGVLSKDSLLYKTGEYFGSFTFRSMDMILVLGRDMEKVIARRLGDLKVPVRVITNGRTLKR